MTTNNLSWYSLFFTKDLPKLPSQFYRRHEMGISFPMFARGEEIFGFDEGYHSKFGFRADLDAFYELLTEHPYFAPRHPFNIKDVIDEMTASESDYRHFETFLDVTTYPTAPVMRMIDLRFYFSQTYAGEVRVEGVIAKGVTAKLCAEKVARFFGYDLNSISWEPPQSGRKPTADDLPETAQAKPRTFTNAFHTTDSAPLPKVATMSRFDMLTLNAGIRKLGKPSDLYQHILPINSPTQQIIQGLIPVVKCFDLPAATLTQSNVYGLPDAPILSPAEGLDTSFARLDHHLFGGIHTLTHFYNYMGRDEVRTEVYCFHGITMTDRCLDALLAQQEKLSVNPYPDIEKLHKGVRFARLYRHAQQFWSSKVDAGVSVVVEQFSVQDMRGVLVVFSKAEDLVKESWNEFKDAMRRESLKLELSIENGHPVWLIGDHLPGVTTIRLEATAGEALY